MTLIPLAQVFALAQEVMKMIQERCPLSEIQHALKSASVLVKPPGFVSHQSGSLLSHTKTEAPAITDLSLSIPRRHIASNRLRITTPPRRIEKQGGYTVHVPGPEEKLTSLSAELGRIGISHKEVRTKGARWIECL